ncbi:hypothetical protein [Mangrovibrevibacter kandeliae]|uniref:hypothetical protein n=1 Tax=Mangrovibrevibacter kandeliae TaxID=2968473 RepID=UPI0021179502|nr:hypothetical protein [Aurantimonas sp. CSK15Z-1]MCQ8781689.1 hypothetical protein [Aurantimonas sp. CSK15Z-1]
MDDSKTGEQTPKITIWRSSGLGRPYQCDIDEGIGHHGIGKTPAEALYNAAAAWRRATYLDEGHPADIIDPFDHAGRVKRAQLGE